MKHTFGKTHVNYQLLQLFDFEGVFQISFEFLLKRKRIKKTESQGPSLSFPLFIVLAGDLRSERKRYLYYIAPLPSSPPCASEHVCSVVWGLCTTAAFSIPILQRKILPVWHYLNLSEVQTLLWKFLTNRILL